MLKYDYLIKRVIGENDLQEFRPDKIDNKLPNLVYIEGPNSSGKSTLLNITALGFYGNKSKKINTTLINRMKSLIDSDYQQIKFNFEINSLDNKIILKSSKNDLNSNEIILEESINGSKFRPLSFERFDSKYNLIYDIPNNPTERLYDLLDEIREEQLRYGNKISGFLYYLRDLFTTITQYRDPERLSNLKDWIADYKERKEKNELKKPEQEKFLTLLEKYTYIKYYAYYLHECQRINDKIIELEEEEKILKQTKKKVSSRSYKLKGEISHIQDNIRKIITNMTPLITSLLPLSEKEYFEIWKELNIYKIIDYELDKSIEIVTSHLYSIFYDEKVSIEADESYQNAYVLDNIIKFLKEYEDSSILIPKLKISIKEFIHLLEEENKMNKLIIEKYEALKEVTDNLQEIKTFIESINLNLDELKKVASEDEGLTDEIYEFIEEKPQIEKIRETLNEYNKKYELYLKKCLSKDIDIESLQTKLPNLIKEFSNIDELKLYFSLTEKQLESRIIDNQKELERIKKEIVSYETLIEKYEEEKNHLEKQEPHKYENYKKEITELIKIFEKLSQKLLRTYDNYINKLINNEVEDYKNKQEEKYYSQVFKYLAYKIGEFRHIEKIYKAQKVDLIKGIIVTEDNLIIHLSDMGTGQSQSAYLLGLLNVKDDNRKIIALFDEIAMMDETSLKPVYDKLRELYKSNRLLLGIVVQKGEEVLVKSLEKK